jgi:hypothetical protein
VGKERVQGVKKVQTRLTALVQIRFKKVQTGMLGTGKENFIGVGVGIGIGIGIDQTNWISTPIPIPTPTPMTQSPHTGIGDRERDGVIDRHLCDGEFARFER